MAVENSQYRHILKKCTIAKQNVAYINKVGAIHCNIFQCLMFSVKCNAIGVIIAFNLKFWCLLVVCTTLKPNFRQQTVSWQPTDFLSLLSIRKPIIWSYYKNTPQIYSSRQNWHVIVSFYSFSFFVCILEAFMPRWALRNAKHTP